MFDVAPGLFVERVEGGKKMALKAICRPTVLVHSGHEEPKQSPTVINWLWESAGGSQGPAAQRAGAPKSEFTRPVRRLHKL